MKYFEKEAKSKTSKGEAVLYTSAAGAAGAYAGLRAGEGLGNIHKSITVDTLQNEDIKKLPKKLVEGIRKTRVEHAAKVSKKFRRLGAIAGGALGAGAAANYFIRKNI